MSLLSHSNLGSWYKITRYKAVSQFFTTSVIFLSCFCIELGGKYRSKPFASRLMYMTVHVENILPWSLHCLYYNFSFLCKKSNFVRGSNKKLLWLPLLSYSNLGRQFKLQVYSNKSAACHYFCHMSHLFVYRQKAHSITILSELLN